MSLTRFACVALLVVSMGVRSNGSPPVHMVTSSAASTGSWTVYHHDDGHSGYDNSLPSTLTSVSTGWVSPTLDDEVYASPLISGGLVYVATLNDTVYALHQSDGTEAWHNNLGAPQTTGWDCGNVSPQGILGTPVIDAAGGRIYVAAFFSDDTYHVIGLSLTTGLVQRDVTLNVSGFIWQIQQQRGALALANGYVYVPFGGRAGDCGHNGTPYRGYVVAVPTSGTGTPPVYTTASGGAGIWAAGGVVVDDATGNVFAATGNGISGGCNSVDQNDAVVRLSPTMALQDYFMPNDWQANWCSNDEDLGSAGPLIISPSLMFQAGKWGGGFLLNPNNLGGVDGQVFPTPKGQTYSQANVCFGNTHDATFGSFAYAAPFVYLSCEGSSVSSQHALVALNINTGAPSFSPCNSTCAAPDWSAGNGLTFGPPIVAGGAVWVVNNGGGLYAYNATTGAPIYHSAGFGVNRFVTPAEAGGQVFVPSHTVIRSFDMNFVPWNSLGGVIQGDPVVVSGGANQMDLFIRGSDDGLWHRSWNGTSWSAWESLGGVLSADPSVVALSSTTLDVFIRGVEGGLWHRKSTSGVWGGWESLGGVLTGGPKGVGVGTSSLAVFIVGSDNALWERAWNGTWSAWQYLDGYHTAPPNAASSSATRVDVYVRGGDSGLWQRTWNGSTWGNWLSLGGVLPTDPVAIIETGTRIDLFARGSDNGIWQNTWNGSSWGGWTPRGGYMIYAPAVSTCTVAHFDVFHVGSDSAIWQIGFNGSTWGTFQKLGGTWTSSPVAVCPATSTSYYLFARGTGGDVWEVGLAAS